MVAGVVVLLAALAGGGYLAGQHFGWFGERPVAIKPPPDPVRFVPAVHAVGADAPAPTSQGVAAALAGPKAAPALGTLTGSVIDPASGQPLWQQNETTALTPASTTKLLTAAAALLALDHADTLTTKVVQGSEPGTVVLVGGGDPTLDSTPAGQQNLYPGSAKLDDLVAQVKQNAGGAPVTKVLVDASRYSGDGMAPGWDGADVAAGSITPIGPVMVDGGRQNPAENYSPRVNTPGAVAAQELAARLGATGGGQGTAPAGAKVLGEVHSAAVEQLVANLLLISDNVLAEAVGREVAHAKGSETSFAGATRSVLDVLKANGFDTSGVVLSDCSGLSVQDKVPAKLFANILAVAAKPDTSDPRTAKLRPLLAGLPVAGGSGTLSGRYTTGPTSVGRGWLRAKTGTLTEPMVNSLAGLVVDTDGRLLVFAFMSNSEEKSADPVRAALDGLAATLRTCGCH